MKNDPIDKLFQIDDRGRLLREVAQLGGSFGPGQAPRIAAHARTLGAALGELRLGIVHTYTSDLLDPWLDLAAALHGFQANTCHAPYGLALQEARSDSPLVQHRSDITLLLLRREDLHPDLSRPLTGLDADAQAALKAQALERLQDIVRTFRAHPVGHLVVTLLPPLVGPGMGLYDLQFERSEGAWLAAFKSEAAAWLRREVPSSLYLDLDEVRDQVGRAGFLDRRFWYSATFPFAPAAAFELSRRVAAIGQVLRTPKAKVIVLDADNTLWGGIIGEDGIDGIALGPEYPGRVYVDFQRRLLDYQRRGFILAMCSKNNERDVLEVLERHPHQVLRDEHFAARRVNWVPKPDNLESLAQELNLGLDSFIFVDDSDHECAAVRHRLPQVEVVQVPARAVDIPGCLDLVARLEVLSLTAEDLAKTRLYDEERKRRALSDDVARTGGGQGDYLTRLGMRMSLRFDPHDHVPRLAQLTGKTNQFNLTTRRYAEQQMKGFVDAPDWLVADFSLADVFGDSGVVGLALWKIAHDEAELDTFLMSCRVIGREAESAFLHATLRRLAERGVRRVTADYIPTAKNDLVRQFLPEQGFERGADGRYRLDLTRTPPREVSSFPIAVAIA